MHKNVQSLLAELEKTREKYWNISPEVGLFLNQLIRTRGYKAVLEIGTSNGYSGLWMAEALSHNSGKLYTIESHKKERFKLATTNFEKSGLKNIHQILGHAPEDLPKTPRHFDLAFFDATKKEHPSFFTALENRIKKGGMIITDNLNSHRKELKPYIKIANKNNLWSSTELNIGTGLLISVKL